MADAQERGIAALTRLKERLDAVPEAEVTESQENGRDPRPASVWLPRDPPDNPGHAPDYTEGADDEPRSADAPGDQSEATPGGDPSPWMVIAQQAPQGPWEQGSNDAQLTPPPETAPSPERADAVAPDAKGSNSEESGLGARPGRSTGPAAGEWLPAQIQQQDDPPATGAWLPGQDIDWVPEQDTAAEPKTGEADRSPWLLPDPATKPVPKTSWVPPELASESELEAFVTAESTFAPPTPEVAPEPVPAGEPEAARASEGDFRSADDLAQAADYDRRTRAVRAYCRELFPVNVAPVVAEQILDSLGRISQDKVLLRLTRKAAARRLTQRIDARRIGGEPCAATPASLAARANGNLTAQERDRLARHLRSCLVCRAMEVRAVRADRAFAAIIGLTLSLD